MIEGKAPSKMKAAVIIPVHKSKTKLEITNYKPISLLQTL